jgi:nucleotide-binding universal stress UspA family protein
MSIICGTDLTPASAAALEVARALAAQRGDREVVLVHVVADESKADTARKQLDEHVTRARGTTPVRAELVIGAPEVSLNTFAETEGSDLVVIAASSKPATLITLGSTAEKVIVAARVPVLVVRDPEPWLAFARRERPLGLLLAIDDSVTCELGTQWVHALRTRGDVDVVLGAVYYPDDASERFGIPIGSMVDRAPELEKLLARDMLRRFGSGERVTARTQRGLGRIGDHVVELARATQVDVIAVGTSQKTGLGRLGSVSAIVVQEAPQSVLCVPPNAVIPTLYVPQLTSALVATDLSQFANRAVPFAFALTPEATGEVHIAHVIDADAEVDEDDVTSQLRALAPRGMQRRVFAHVLRGDDAARTLAQAAARLGVDAICIASHGRSGITRALVGSVADKLLRATRTPVLVLRPA